MPCNTLSKVVRGCISNFLSHLGNWLGGRKTRQALGNPFFWCLLCGKHLWLLQTPVCSNSFLPLLPMNDLLYVPHPYGYVWELMLLKIRKDYADTAAIQISQDRQGFGLWDFSRFLPNLHTHDFKVYNTHITWWLKSDSRYLIVYFRHVETYKKLSFGFSGRCDWI